MKDIIGYEREYAITSCGKVWSYKNQMFLKPYKRADGYLEVKLWKEGKKKGFLIHRLVAQTYIPNPLGLPQVNHKSEVKSENHVNNLEWVTPEANVNHGTRNERAAERFKKPVYCVELDRTFASASDAARELGICRASISSCCCGGAQTAGKLHWRFIEVK